MKTQLEIKRIIISRTDSIGDVVLTLPLCAWMKANFPDCKVLFLGKAYTKPVIDCYSSVDEFVDWQEIEALPSAEKLERMKGLNADAIVHVFPVKEIAALAKKAKIAVRIGTSHRGFHLLTCNHRVNFTRKRSDLHEAQLNFELLRPLGLVNIPTLSDVKEYASLFRPVALVLPQEITTLLTTSEQIVILHPKSQGSAVEWPMENYVALSERLASHGISVFFTGTQTEGDSFRSQLPKNDRIHDLTGKLTLAQLIVLIAQVNALVACSTGPLHIAGLSGIHTIGLFSPRKPIHPGRWQPLGSQVEILVKDQIVPTVKRGKNAFVFNTFRLTRSSLQSLLL